MKVKTAREALAELRRNGTLQVTDNDVAIIRELTSGSEFAEELDQLVPDDE